MNKYFFGTHWYWYWLIIVIPIIAACFVISIFDDNIFCSTILKFIEDWSAFLSAAAAGILAIVAFLAIRNANLQEALRRKHDLERESRDRKEQYLNEIIEWVSVLKLKTLQANVQTTKLERKQRYERIFLAISDALLNAELMNLRASENSIPVEKELNNVWQSAFFCSQLAERIAGKKPTDEQRKRWGKNTLDIVARIDQLEEQGNLTDQEMYNGQKGLLEKISICLKKLVEVEATL